MSVAEIERRILTGEWREGQRVPSFRALADAFNVSRSVINAGMVELAAERRTDQKLEELKAILQTEQKAKSLEEKAIADVRFYHMIVECSHNVVFSLILNSYKAFITELVQTFYEKILTENS
ncbi:MAG: FadR family transcriptional regulator [Fastidiosipila sp.]|nr:FadR family transcriptional regulator [Fastidiosipila sp.]